MTNFGFVLFCLALNIVYSILHLHILLFNVGPAHSRNKSYEFNLIIDNQYSVQPQSVVIYIYCKTKINIIDSTRSKVKISILSLPLPIWYEY